MIIALERCCRKQLAHALGGLSGLVAKICHDRLVAQTAKLRKLSGLRRIMQRAL
jgi:hypothetical protein